MNNIPDMNDIREWKFMTETTEGFRDKWLDKEKKEVGNQ